MKRYLILQHPGHNRVYYNASEKLALAELKIASCKMDVTISDIGTIEIAGVRYLSFTCDGQLHNKSIEILSRLSFVFALFEYQSEKGQDILVPISKVPYEYINNKISSLLKYPGKTNELFTKMMVNVALLSSKFSYSNKIQLLDPVAGKGTTMFEAAVYGFNAFGVELETNAVHELNTFFKKYLQTERLKNASIKRQVAGQKKSEATYIHEFEYAKSKEEFKENEKRKKLGIVNGPSQYLNRFFKKNSMHLLVGDLPYGIAHGNTGKRNAGTRNPSELIEECLPAWNAVLKPGGVMVLAWNVFVASHKRLADIISKGGFEVLNAEPYLEFEHMVDKSIKRNIIVARKVN